MAKKVFYVCTGLCFLALAFTLGALRATAQQGQTEFSIGEVQSRSGEELAGIVNRVLVIGHMAGTLPGDSYVADGVTPPIPGTSPIIAAEPSARVVLLANGDVYHFV